MTIKKILKKELILPSENKAVIKKLLKKLDSYPPAKDPISM